MEEEAGGESMKAYDVEKQEYVEMTEEETAEWNRDQRQLIAN